MIAVVAAGKPDGSCCDASSSSLQRHQSLCLLFCFFFLFSISRLCYVSPLHVSVLPPPVFQFSPISLFSFSFFQPLPSISVSLYSFPSFFSFLWFFFLLFYSLPSIFIGGKQGGGRGLLPLYSHGTRIGWPERPRGNRSRGLSPMFFCLW